MASRSDSCMIQDGTDRWTSQRVRVKQIRRASFTKATRINQYQSEVGPKSQCWRLENTPKRLFCKRLLRSDGAWGVAAVLTVDGTGTGGVAWTELTVVPAVD